MSPLKDKKIVICRRPEQAREMVLALQKKKAWPIVFSTFAVEPLGLSATENRILREISGFDWLVLGSENGIRFFAALLRLLTIRQELLTGLYVGTVGKKTAAAWGKHFPKIPVRRQVDSLQQLIIEIEREQAGESAAILNPTSRQSLQNIKVQIPAGISLTRLPIYETVPDRSHDAGEIGFIRSGEYDAIFFGSPSSFDYFLEIVGGTPHRKNVALCVSGKTTARHIESAGFRVHVIPARPEAESVIGVLENYFDNKLSIKSPILKETSR